MVVLQSFFIHNNYGFIGNSESSVVIENDEMEILSIVLLGHTPKRIPLRIIFLKVFTNEIRKELAKYPIGSQRVGKNAVIAAKVVLPVCENPTPYFYILEYDGGDSLVILWHDGIENDDFSYQNQSIMELEKCYDVAISENWELPAIEFIGKSMKEVAKNDIALSNFAASDKYSDYSFLNSTFNY